MFVFASLAVSSWELRFPCKPITACNSPTTMYHGHSLSQRGSNVRIACFPSTNIIYGMYPCFYEDDDLHCRPQFLSSCHGRQWQTAYANLYRLARSRRRDIKSPIHRDLTSSAIVLPGKKASLSLAAQMPSRLSGVRCKHSQRHATSYRNFTACVSLESLGTTIATCLSWFG